MIVTYKNFRGDMYYLHSRLTKKGNTTYHFAKKSAGADVREIPEGYEIYEDPNGKVYLRKILKQLINDNEIKTIETAMEKHCPIKDFKIDVKKEYIYIYTVSTPLDELKNLTPFTSGVNFDKYKDYETMLRFTLIDKQNRIFAVERFCFLGGIEDWIDLDSSENLQKLAMDYVQHIGQDSFFDLI